MEMEIAMKKLMLGMVLLGVPALALAQAASPANPAKDARTSTPPNGSQMGTPKSGGAPMSADESKARSALTSAGYTDIKNLRHGANGWEATATRDGKEGQVRISASGTVSPATPGAR